MDSQNRIGGTKQNIYFLITIKSRILEFKKRKSKIRKEYIHVKVIMIKIKDSDNLIGFSRKSIHVDTQI